MTAAASATATSRRSVRIGARAVGVAATALVLVTAGWGATQAHAASPAAITYPSQNDPNSVGGIEFFAADGSAITGGSLTSVPFAAYAQGTTAIRTGDTNAAIYGTLPVKATPSAGWTSQVLGGPSTYPNSGAPGSLGTSKLPLYSGVNTDEPLSSLVANDGRPSSEPYSGIYQLRLETTQAQHEPNSTYDSADISVNSTAGTWQVVYDKLPLTATTTSLSVSKKGPISYGTSETLSASVTAGVAGTVTFKDGSSVLGKQPVSSGSARLTTKTLSVRTHSLSASFTPTDQSTYAGSTSKTISVKVTAKATKVALTTSAKSIAHGKKLTLTATASPVEGGSVTFTDNGKALKKVSVSKKGVATYTTTGLKVGAQKLQAKYAPSSKTYAASSSSVVTVTVKK